MASSLPTVLVTGGAGYIGSHTCKVLAEAGFRPVVYDSLVSGHRWAVKWGPLEEGDIADRARLAQVITRHRPAAVIHFAAFIAAGESVVDPAKYYQNNTAGTLALLETLREAGVPRIVFSSTAAVYGNPVEVPITETHPLAPINPYGRSKLAVETILHDFVAAYGFRAGILRYFNACGAAPEAGIGEDHEPETHLIPRILFVAQGREPHVSVFGDDYATPDGTCIRDYVHVLDLAEAHVLALRRVLSADGVGTFNLGTGSGYSVQQVIAAARAVTGHPLPVKIGPRREGDPPVLVADNARARADLGWTLARSSLERQVADAWAWANRAHGVNS